MREIAEMLQEAGMAGDDLQYNLLHASLSRFGARQGLDARVREVLERRHPDLFTQEARREQREDFSSVLTGIVERFFSRLA